MGDKTNDHPITDSNLTTVPDAPTFFVNHKGEYLECSPVVLIKKKSRKDLVEYRCVHAKKQVAYPEDEKNPDFKVGQNETEQLRLDIKEKRSQEETYTVKIPQSNLKHISLARFSASRQLSKTPYRVVINTLLPAKLYISFRPKFANSGKDGGLSFRKGGSRGGFYYYRDFGDKVQLALQYEANIKSGESFINTSDDENTSRRLSYLSLAYERKYVEGTFWLSKYPYNSSHGQDDKA